MPCSTRGLPQGLEAPVMTPNGVIFPFFFFFLCHAVVHASLNGLGSPASALGCHTCQQ